LLDVSSPAPAVRPGLRPVTGRADEILALLQAWDVEDAPEPLVIATSGSTGRPKRVVLSRAAMRASAHATLSRLGGPGQWVLNLPATYVAGVQVLYRSVVAGTEPVVQQGDLTEAVAGMTGPRRYLSLVPTQLVRLLADSRDVAAATHFDAVLVGGGPLAARDRAEAVRAGIRVVSTYGMSETCGGCVYDGMPLDGVAVKIDAEGQVWLAGPMLFDGYDGDPALTESVLRDGWLRTSDLGRLDEDGRLDVLGRVDDVVISGGVKVPPYAVERMLLRHPGVRAVQVVGVPDPEWGERVVAVVAGEVAPDELRDLVQPRTWAPKDVVVVPELPLLPNGKVDRSRLRGLAS
jgi:O-succinylbenzoic acid--CoA ligase